MANPDREKMDSSAQSAKVLVEAVKKGIKPRDIVTRKSIENAVALIMATGGSTNAVLHYLAIAHAAEVEWTLDDFERVRRKVPVLCDLKPSGRYMAVDLHKAGGVPQVLKILLNAGLLHGDCLTITGRTIAEELAAVPDEPRSDQDVIRPYDRPLYREGHLAVLKGNLAEGGAVAKISGLKSPVMSGPARVFEDEQSAMDAILSDRIRPGDILVLRYLGPKGRPGNARDARADLGDHRPGPGRQRRPYHRRPLLGRHLGHGRRPRHAGSFRRRHDRAGGGGRPRSSSMPISSCCNSMSTAEELAKKARTVAAAGTALQARRAGKVCSAGAPGQRRGGHRLSGISGSKGPSLRRAGSAKAPCLLFLQTEADVGSFGPVLLMKRPTPPGSDFLTPALAPSQRPAGAAGPVR